MAGRSRNPEISKQREQQAWDLRTKCYTQVQIAARLGITQQAVSAILKRVSERATARLDEEILEKKVQQDASLMHIFCEALKEWEKSKKKAEKITTVEVPNPVAPPFSAAAGEGPTRAVPAPEIPVDPAHATAFKPAATAPRAAKRKVAGYIVIGLKREVVSRCGDPKYLEVAMKALADIRKLWGLDAPQRAGV
jgi:predicted transcriptional regulator